MGISSIVILLSCVVLVYGAAVPKSDVIEYVKSLSLGALSELKDGPTPSDYKVEGYVDGGSLVSFTSNLTGSEKTDVLYSNLFAQLFADERYDRFTETENWNQKFVQTLGVVGYVVQDTQIFEQYKSAGSYYMNDAVFDLLSSTVPDAKLTLDVTEKTLWSLRWMEDTNPRKAAFFQKSYRSKMGNFQILACTKSDKASKEAVVLLGHFYFNATSDYPQYLFAQWDEQTMSLYWRAVVVTFNLEHFSFVRSTVEKKLEEKGVLNTLIGNLKI